MSFSPPGGNNTYIPTYALSGSLQVDFSRNTRKFPVNSLTKLIPVSKQRGKFLYFDPLDIARFTGGTTNQYVWAPGTLPNPGNEEQYGFEFREYTTKRHLFGSTLDQLGVDQAEWPVVKSYSDLLGQKAMTNRAIQVSNLITTSGNHVTGHFSASTAIGYGSKWDTGTLQNPVLKKGLMAAAAVIQRDTVSRINFKDLCIVMNPNTATALSTTEEVHTYLAQSQYAKGQLTGGVEGQNAIYGLMDNLYGFKVVVEDTVYNDDNKLASSATPSFVFPDDTIVMLLRDGDLEGSEGAANYSTVGMFVYEDMSVSTLNNDWDRVVRLRVVDDFVPRMVAPVTSYLVTDVLT